MCLRVSEFVTPSIPKQLIGYMTEWKIGKCLGTEGVKELAIAELSKVCELLQSKPLSYPEPTSGAQRLLVRKSSFLCTNSAPTQLITHMQPTEFAQTGSSKFQSLRSEADNPPETASATGHQRSFAFQIPSFSY